MSRIPDESINKANIILESGKESVGNKLESIHNKISNNPKFRSLLTKWSSIMSYMFSKSVPMKKKAMILGGLNIKDYFNYKKGSFATEMPLFMRPKVKKIIKKITSPRGAFIIGFIVTLFLLPCTMGPYVIASGLLAELGTLGALPWLMYYNLLFIIPMLIIVLLVYFGFSKVDEVSGWKERNIKKLHLIAGILLFLVGVALLNGWL